MGLVDTSRATEALHAAIERFAESTDGCRAVVVYGREEWTSESSEYPKWPQVHAAGSDDNTADRGDMYVDAAAALISAARFQYTEAAGFAEERNRYEAIIEFCAEHGINRIALDDGTHRVQMVPIPQSDGPNAD